MKELTCVTLERKKKAIVTYGFKLQFYDHLVLTFKKVLFRLKSPYLYFQIRKVEFLRRP